MSPWEAWFRSALVDDINIVAQVDSAVFAQGETGTGNEVLRDRNVNGMPGRENHSCIAN